MTWRLPASLRRRLRGSGVWPPCAWPWVCWPQAAPAPAPQPGPNPLGLDLPPAGALRGELSLAAGSLSPTWLALCGGVDGEAGAATVGVVVAMTVAPDGRLFFAERPKHLKDCAESPQTRRVRVLDDLGRIRTLRTWVLAPASDVVDVNALAINAAGEVFVAQGYPSRAVFASPGYPLYRDGEAPGIWRLNADGTASLLAGQARAYRGFDAADGVGTQAVFVDLWQMVWGQDGLLYLNDWGKIRTVDAQGQVHTLAQAGRLIGHPGGRVLAWQAGDAGASAGRLVDVPSGAAWHGVAAPDGSRPVADGRGGLYALPSGLSGRIVRLLANGSSEQAVGTSSGAGSTQLGALPAQLGRVQAMAGAHDHALYIAVEGAIVKARFTP